MKEYYGIASTPNDSFIAHYGIKGMKWGVRRYQNEDGSLTSKGKKQVARSGLYLNINHHIRTAKWDKKAKAWKPGTPKIPSRENRGNVISESHNYREEHHDEMFDRPHVPSKRSKEYDDYIKDKYASATLKDLGLKDNRRARNSVKGLYKSIDPDYKFNWYPNNTKREEFKQRRKDIMHPTRAKIRKSIKHIRSGIGLASDVKNLVRK